MEDPFSESYWNSADQLYYNIINTKTGERKKIKINIDMMSGMDPAGKFIIGTDFEKRDIYSYELATGVIRNITKLLPIPSVDDEFVTISTQKDRGLSIAAWLADDEGVLIYDRFDIWQIDPAGKKKPMNLTNGYGRRNNIYFFLADIYRSKPITKNEPLILEAFDQTNKNNGFYRINLSKNGDPELLTMGPYIYGKRRNGFRFSLSKARDAEVYLIKRENASESPNYFWTTDLKKFFPISTVYPERRYNWLTSELVPFKTLDGHNIQGVLYKPENFDPTKKYPIIFHYYEKKADQLHQYRPPVGIENTSEISISYFVGLGYLIFTPDIHFKMGYPGESVVNSVVAAAQHFSKYPWVDTKHMGIQGQSFGGYETNYIITHTDIFAAAVSGAGFSNLISSYGDLWSGGEGWGEYLETGSGRIGATPWQRLDLYIMNSPIFQAGKVVTPILMMHNKKDHNVSFHHGVAWFTALRRLGKRAWMLQYDEGGHNVGIGDKNAIDYTIRMTQFFDHYLKGAPAPKWMTQGIPAKMKGIDNGFELDDKIKTPGAGLSEKAKTN